MKAFSQVGESSFSEMIWIDFNYDYTYTYSYTMNLLVLVSIDRFVSFFELVYQIALSFNFKHSLKFNLSMFRKIDTFDIIIISQQQALPLA